MKKNSIIGIGVIGIALTGYVAYAFYDGKAHCEDDLCQISEADLALLATDTATLPPIDGPRGSFEDYSEERLAELSTDTVILFFHATWCPSCRALSTDIELNADAIPEGITILKADYDVETELRKRYGITTQHTLVQIDAQGDLIKKWSGGSRLETVLLEIQ